MKWSDLLREAVAEARCSLVPSALVALVVAATACVSLITVGRQAALEADLARTLAGPSARTLTVTDNENSHALQPVTVAALAGLSTAEAAVGLGTPVDVSNAAVGEPAVALVALTGHVERAVQLTRGRLPANAGEAIVSSQLQAKLNLVEPLGALEAGDGRQWSIVGSFEVQEPFGDLAAMAVTVAEGDVPLRQIKVIATSVDTAAANQSAALSIVAANDSRTTVDSSLAAASSGQEVGRQVSGYGRGLFLLLLGAGGFLVAIVVLADVLIRSRDLGRRRTLGIARADLVTLVVLRTAVPAGLGAGVGAAAGLIIGWVGGAAPGADFALAVVVLSALAAMVAAAPPAVLAAHRDPVAVLRTA